MVVQNVRKVHTAEKRTAQKQHKIEARSFFARSLEAEMIPIPLASRAKTFAFALVIRMKRWGHGMAVEEKEGTVRVLEWAGAECLSCANSTSTAICHLQATVQSVQSFAS